MRRLITILSVGALALSSAACSTITSGSAGGTGGVIDGTSWRLTSYDVSGTSTPVPAEVIVDARFAAGTIAGSSGCNSYAGPATVTGSAIKIGPLAGTKMACEAPASDVEAAYLANLANAASFTATADALTIFASNGPAILCIRLGRTTRSLGNGT